MSASRAPSHDLSVVRYLAHHIGVMYLGKLVEIGTSDEVYSRPDHPHTRALLDAVAVPDPAVERALPETGSCSRSSSSTVTWTTSASEAWSLVCSPGGSSRR